MSITGAFSNALSGLNAVSRAAAVVSSNVSNATTEGYARREIELTSQTVGTTGSGVKVNGVSRNTDPVVIGERRIADGEVALAQTRIDLFETVTQALGQPNEQGSITGHIVTFEASLIEAASRPDSEARLSEIVQSAQNVATEINAAADTLMAARIAADDSIDITVNSLNTALQQVVDLNIEIEKRITSGYDANSLMDQRQIVIDSISEIIPVKEISRDNSMISLYSTGGAVLVDYKASEISFISTPTITPDMSIQSGVLSGLTINGHNVSTDADSGMISGGQLAGLFEVRDILIPDAQAKLDALTRDLIERFETTDTDPTLSLGDPGLFTDAGNALDVSIEIGISNRLSINSLVDPAAGGDVWKIRDGLGAASEGNQGDATLLHSLASALQSSKVPASGGFTSSARSAADLSASLFSTAEVELLNLEAGLSFSVARQENLQNIELAAGVDTDFELQQLLVIEQAYAANAKVIETIDSLFDDLFRILG